jgi:16S rRNA A1518/A1519 N6-dimethyltransferase RsmA/KsgA/DIM1 with predicted DNA glycosylase/AP lyase activity
VAEIGVGTGILTSALLRRPECTGVVGLELDEEILKEGWAKEGET